MAPAAIIDRRDILDKEPKFQAAGHFPSPTARPRPCSRGGAAAHHRPPRHPGQGTQFQAAGVSRLDTVVYRLGQQRA